MRELQIYGIRYCLDWYRDTEPTQEEMYNILTAANESLYDDGTSPQIGFDLLSDLTCMIVVENDTDEEEGVS